MNKPISKIHIRGAGLEDASSIARVRVTTWQSTYRGLIPQDYLDSLSTIEYTAHWQGILAANGRQGYACVAESESTEIIGFALGGVERSQNPIFKGELYALYILDSYQNHGIGRKLVSAIARHLILEGINSMLVWVLSDNPARAFYEALGGEPLYEKPMMISGKELKQIAYGWQNLITLIESQTDKNFTSGE